MFCQHCGKAEQLANSYCRNCGEFLSNESSFSFFSFGGNSPQQNVNTINILAVS